MIYVHVIPPDGLKGHRHEERFRDGTTDAQVLDALTKPREIVNSRTGETEIWPPLQKGYGRLKVSDEEGHPGILYLDHPQTIVAVGTIDRETSPQGIFVETRRLKGPPS